MSRPFLADPRRALPMLVLLVSVAALAVAFASQYLGGLQPCVLCIYQRYPYGVAIGLAILALALPDRPALQRGVLTLAGLALLTSAGIAAFHVGVEQNWWQGTSACGGAIEPGLSLEELRDRLMAAPVVRCDEVPWSLFGLSMAGYNLLYAGGFGLLVLWLTARLPSRRFSTREVQ